MSRTILLGAVILVGACNNAPARPMVPVDEAKTGAVYNAALTEVKRLMAPPPGTQSRVNWAERVYLNPLILMPASDSASRFIHDARWLADAQVKGMVRGTCGQPPAAPCPDTIAFVSLGIPWTRGGDTSFVLAGFVPELPGLPTNTGIFWLMTVTHNDLEELKVSSKGPPRYITFNARKN